MVFSLEEPQKSLEKTGTGTKQKRKLERKKARKTPKARVGGSGNPVLSAGFLAIWFRQHGHRAMNPKIVQKSRNSFLEKFRAARVEREIGGKFCFEGSDSF